jgi:NarL family two-component system response regulator LiaR
LSSLCSWPSAAICGDIAADRRTPLEPERISVLICDDQPVFARALAHLLESECEDFKVLGIASDGAEAERLVKELFPDIVLMDIYMPGQNGIETTRRIHGHTPSTKIVMLTASDEEADLYAALRAGACGYMTKDKDVAELTTVIRSVAGGYLVVPCFLAGRMLDDLAQSDPSGLSDTEREILNGISRGETNKHIAARLHLSERTLRRRLQDIYSKLHLADRLEAAVFAAGGPPSGEHGAVRPGRPRPLH